MSQIHLQGESLLKAIDDYVNNYSSDTDSAKSTVKNRNNTLRRIYSWLNGREFDQNTVVEYFREYKKNHARSSHLSQMKLVKAFLTFLVEHKHIMSEDNFTSFLKLPKEVVSPWEYIEPTICDKIIEEGCQEGLGDKSRSRYYKNEGKLCLKFMLRTGLRSKEARSLIGSDLYLYQDPSAYYALRKGGKIKEKLFVPLDMLDVLKDRTAREKVFDVSEDLLNDILKRGATRLGVTARVHSHLLRKVFISNHARHGMNPIWLKKLAGHADIKTTLKYYVDLDDKDLALEMNANQNDIMKDLPPKQILDLGLKEIMKTRIYSNTKDTPIINQTSNTLSITFKV